MPELPPEDRPDPDEDAEYLLSQHLVWEPAVEGALASIYPQVVRYDAERFVRNVGTEWLNSRQVQVQLVMLVRIALEYIAAKPEVETSEQELWSQAREEQFLAELEHLLDLLRPPRGSRKRLPIQWLIGMDLKQLFRQLRPSEADAWEDEPSEADEAD